MRVDDHLGDFRRVVMAGMAGRRPNESGHRKSLLEILAVPVSKRTPARSIGRDYRAPAGNPIGVEAWILPSTSNARGAVLMAPTRRRVHATALRWLAGRQSDRK